jgi:2-polyprenyl-3-methyl-5-hydroxy-6-metoxy-1,4-benzoquinol methylase
MKTVAPPDYWDKLNGQRGLAYYPDQLPFRDVFARHIKPHQEIFEVGCYPGGFLIYLSTHFDSVANGIDITPDIDIQLPVFLTTYGAKVGNITQGDFFHFSPDRQFDVVCSFGFIEHFFDYRSVIRRHITLVRPGGIVFLSCPNFRRLQFLLHWLFDRENLKRHVVEAMNLRSWKQVLTESGMEVLEMGYHRTFDFWVESHNNSRIAAWCVRWIKRLAAAIDKRVTWPNPFLSPFMFCVARKR